jgi:hypothetical protein
MTIGLGVVAPSGEFKSEPPTAPNLSLVPCPACCNETGESTGDRLVQLESGTWVRQPCAFCSGSGTLDAEGLARYRTRSFE